MMGCSRDHSKELDIYNKSYAEKMARARTLKDTGNVSFKAQDYEKSAYYYAQALLIFYYLIPDTAEEEQESNELKHVCHMNQALTYSKLNRLGEAATEIEQALKIKPKSVKSIIRKGQIMLARTEFELAEQEADKA